MQSLNSVSNWIAGSPVATLLLFLAAVLGIISFALMIFLYLKGKRVKRVEFFIWFSQPLVDNWMGMIPGLEVAYQKRPIENLTVTLALIGNAGTEVVDRQEIPDSEPIAVVAKGGHRILDARIPEPFAKEFGLVDRVAVEARDDGRKAEIIFDYLDRKECIFLSILHTGGSADAIAFQGRIKGGTFARARPTLVDKYRLYRLRLSKKLVAKLLKQRKTPSR